mmetsp:Transcript_62785/g.146158  ORF Transcript_62785/g.146158 Transcript_62785/m.146158 type:complete len:102 (-) Transcript_62785:6-311(-)
MAKIEQMETERQDSSDDAGGAASSGAPHVALRCSSEVGTSNIALDHKDSQKDPKRASSKMQVAIQAMMNKFMGYKKELAGCRYCSQQLLDDLAKVIGEFAK